MFKVDLSKTDFTSVETYENTVKEAEMELENRRKELENRQKELEEYKRKGKERIKQLTDWVVNSEVKFTGEIRKLGKGVKELKIIMIFPDETQRIYVLKSNKVEELRDAVEQMKKVYSQCDWSAFDYKLR